MARKGWMIWWFVSVILKQAVHRLHITVAMETILCSIAVMVTTGAYAYACPDKQKLTSDCLFIFSSMKQNADNNSDLTPFVSLPNGHPSNLNQHSRDSTFLCESTKKGHLPLGIVLISIRLQSALSQVAGHAVHWPSSHQFNYKETGEYGQVV